MKPYEKGFLLLTCELGDPGSKPLTVAQFRTLTQRVRMMERPVGDRDIVVEDVMKLGYTDQEAAHILYLLTRREQLERYLQEAEKCGCACVARNSLEYPARLRVALGEDAPAAIWTKGDLDILSAPMVALVGSRDLREENRRFAEEVGRVVAKLGYTLVSGNARGADRTAQETCLAFGGRVVSVVADRLSHCESRENVLYLSQDGFSYDFTAARALSRNHIIHSLGEKAFVAQCNYGKGGTWSGTHANLKNGRSTVYCFDDGSEAAYRLAKLGAKLIDMHNIEMVLI